MTERQYVEQKRALEAALIAGKITYKDYLEALDELYKKHN